jgi:hypothetical protein
MRVRGVRGRSVRNRAAPAISLALGERRPRDFDATAYYGMLADRRRTAGTTWTKQPSGLLSMLSWEHVALNSSLCGARGTMPRGRPDFRHGAELALRIACYEKASTLRHTAGPRSARVIPQARTTISYACLFNPAANYSAPPCI